MVECDLAKVEVAGSVNTKVQAEESKYDSLKWVAVVAIVVAGVVGNSMFSDESLLYRVLALLVLAVAAGFIVLQTQKAVPGISCLKMPRVKCAV